MKGFILSLVTLFLSAPVLADEHIKLSQVVGSGGAAAPTGDISSTETAGETTTATGTSTYVAVGVLIAAGIGVIAGTNSSSSH